MQLEIPTVPDAAKVLQQRGKKGSLNDVCNCCRHESAGYIFLTRLRTGSRTKKPCSSSANGAHMLNLNSHLILPVLETLLMAAGS
jgi:hypothetical protein